MPKKRAAKPMGRKKMKSTKGGGVPVGTVTFTVDGPTMGGFQTMPGQVRLTPNNPKLS